MPDDELIGDRKYRDDLQRAFALKKSGNELEARKILRNIVQHFPQNDKAWLWLAETYPDRRRRIAVLEDCLENIPGCRPMEELLAILEAEEEGQAEEEKKAVERKPTPKESREIPEQRELAEHADLSIRHKLRAEDDLHASRMAGKPEAGGKSARKAMPLGTFLILLGLLAVGGIFGGSILLRGGRPSPPAVNHQTSTATPSLSPTAIPSPTVAPSPTASRTNTPAATFTETQVIFTATVNLDLVYLREGPSGDHKIVTCPQGDCSYPKGTQVVLAASHQVLSEIWYLVSMPDGKSGWLMADWLLTNGDQGALPTASAYPTYPPHK
jgi:hypothetical protein